MAKLKKIIGIGGVALLLLLAILKFSGLLGGGETQNSLGMLDYTAYIVGDNIVVDGTVNDDFMALPGEANPQPGASITLKGTNYSVTSDERAFTSYPSPKHMKIRYSYSNMKTFKLCRWM